MEYLSNAKNNKLGQIIWNNGRSNSNGWQRSDWVMLKKLTTNCNSWSALK